MAANNCSVCVRADRPQIEKHLVLGDRSLRDLAAMTGLSRSALHRHKQHISPDYRMMMIVQHGPRAGTTGTESTGQVGTIELPVWGIGKRWAR